MKKWNIVVTRKMLDNDIQYIKSGLENEVGQSFEFVLPETYDEEGICSVAENADIFLGPYITENIMKAAPNLKLIQIPWTGIDTFDFNAAKDCACPICNTHSNAEAVSEIAVAMVLDILKKISYHDRKMRRGNWNRDQIPIDLKSKMISKQRICILGYGQIGSRIGKILSAMGATVTAVENRNLECAKEVAKYISSENWIDLAAEADIIVCALPLTDLTRDLINDESIKHFKDGVILVNVSRAPIINEKTVFDALSNGKVSAFASDVWWNAPKRGETQSWPSDKYDFTKFDNVIFSPHRAGFVDGELPHLNGAVENIIRLIKGQELICQIDKDKKY